MGVFRREEIPCPYRAVGCLVVLFDKWKGEFEQNGSKWTVTLDMDGTGTFDLAVRQETPPSAEGEEDEEVFWMESTDSCRVEIKGRPIDELQDEELIAELFSTKIAEEVIERRRVLMENFRVDFGSLSM